ncbi:MAG: hypothetical protein JXB47_01065 [Anaerolineae bacterium]|nr:hypothetical protein [Anaerolineae bacterium]
MGATHDSPPAILLLACLVDDVLFPAEGLAYPTLINARFGVDMPAGGAARLRVVTFIQVEQPMPVRLEVAVFDGDNMLANLISDLQAAGGYQLNVTGLDVQFDRGGAHRLGVALNGRPAAFFPLEVYGELA